MNKNTIRLRITESTITFWIANTQLRTSHYFKCFFGITLSDSLLYEADTAIIPTLQTGNLRSGMCKEVAQK